MKRIMFVIASGFFSACICVTIWIYLAYRYSVHLANSKTLAIRNCGVQQKSTCSTGDLLFMQFKNSDMPKDLETVPLHCGMVWVVNGEPYVIEATRFKYPVLKDYMWNKKENEDGVRVVKLSELKSSVDGFMAIRYLTSGKINNDALFDVMQNWAKDLRFNPLISYHMSVLELITIGFGPAFPNFGKFCAKISGLINHSPDKIFCSQFLCMLLQKLGHINKNFHEHWSIAPVSYIKLANKIDFLSEQSDFPLRWELEVPIVCLNGILA